MNNKYLLVVYDFYPGGCQRQTYELDSTLRKNGISTEILCINDLNSHKYFPDTFYIQHQQLGTPITFLSTIESKKSSFSKTIISRLSRKPHANSLELFLKKYTKVMFFGEYTYRRLQHRISNTISEQITIFVVSSKFQGNIYRDFNKKNNYLFIDGFEDGPEIEYEYENFERYQHITLPLSLNPIEHNKKWKFNEGSSKKIGIFTRLSKAKPLDPFLYSFSILLDRFPEIELHIFGAGSPEEAEYDRYIRHLDLKNVFFRGHQENIKETINNESLDLVWFQGYNQRPAGYAGLDVALTGTPQLFWDFFEGTNSNLNEKNTVYPHFKNISLFVSFTTEVLTTRELAERISSEQFNYVIQNRNMNQNYKVIEHLFK